MPPRQSVADDHSAKRAPRPKRETKLFSGLKFDGDELYFVHEGMRVAKRGQPGTPQAKTWVSLVHGCTVRETRGGKCIEVRYEGGAVH